MSRALLLILTLLTIALSASKSSDSSASSTQKDEHESGKSVVTEKTKTKSKKDTKAADEIYDDEDTLNDYDIDSMFGATLPPSTKKPDGGATVAQPSTESPPLGVFGPGYTSLLDSSEEDDDDDNKKPVTQAPQATAGQGGTFYPIPRQVDVWDRLLILVAFPICFFAVILRAEMCRS